MKEYGILLFYHRCQITYGNTIDAACSIDILFGLLHISICSAIHNNINTLGLNNLPQDGKILCYI